MGVEAMAFFWLIRSFNAIAVELTGRNATDPHMPDVTGPMAHWIQINNPGGGPVTSVLIELTSHSGRVTAEQSEIDPISPLMRTPGHRASCQNTTRLRRCLASIGSILFANRFFHQTLVRCSNNPHFDHGRSSRPVLRSQGW